MKEIKLSKGYVTLVDDKDYEHVSRHKWHALVKKTVVYAQRTIRVHGKKTTIRLHKFIMGSGQFDHEDHDGLNNQRQNLRRCNSGQNTANCRKRAGCSSKYKGVSWDARGKVWKVQVAGKHKGNFPNEILAAKAYDTEARKQFGEFALCNLN